MDEENNKIVEDIKEEMNGEILEEKEENFKEVITEENKEEVLKNKNLESAHNLLTTAVVVEFISVLTYALPLISEGWTDFGFAFEIVALLFAYLAKNNAKYKEENKAIRNTIISLFSLSFLAIYDLIYAFEHRDELITLVNNGAGDFGIQINYGVDLLVLVNIIILISTLVILHRKEIKIKNKKTDEF